MDGFLEGALLKLSIMALPFLLAVTLHEAGHAVSAYFLGDPTAKNLGRLSLNPGKHIDPVGTVFIPLLAVFANIPFLIGYAKPVPIDPRYFKNKTRDNIIVSLAGPMGNFIVALFCGFVLRLALGFGFDGQSWLVNTMYVGVYLNAVFMVFNLLPIPPLDGSHVLKEFLPYEAAVKYESVAPFGFFILMGVIILIPGVITIPSAFVTGLVLNIVGLGGAF